MFNFEDRIDLIFKTSFFNFQFNFSRALALDLQRPSQCRCTSRRTRPPAQHFQHLLQLGAATISRNDLLRLHDVLKLKEVLQNQWRKYDKLFDDHPKKQNMTFFINGLLIILLSIKHSSVSEWFCKCCATDCMLLIVFKWIKVTHRWSFLAR